MLESFRIAFFSYFYYLFYGDGNGAEEKLSSLAVEDFYSIFCEGFACFFYSFFLALFSFFY